MCSKNNPAGAETCRFCGARLTPLTGAGDDVPDWLKDFRDTPADSTPGGTLPWQSGRGDDEAGSLPDWLSDLRGGVLGGDENKIPESSPGFIHSPSSEPESASSDVPDWLRGFSASEEPPAEAPSASSPEVDDWLANLRSDEPPADSGVTAWTPTPVGQEPASETDWPAPSAETQEPASETAVPTTNEDILSWIKSLGNEGPSNLFTEEPTQPSDTLEWSEEALTDSKNQQTGVTEWLETMAHEAPRNEETPESRQRFQEWFSSDDVIREEDSSKPALPAMKSSSELEDLPDWLVGAAAPPPSQGETISSSADSAAPADVPDWLASFAPPEAGGERPEPADASLPDWLSGTASGQPEEISWSAAADATPAWFNPDADQPAEETPAGPAVEAPRLDIPDFAALFAEDKGGGEEKLSADIFEQPAEEPGLGPVLPLAAAAATSASLPAWPEPAAQSGGEEPPPAAEPPVPDWLSAFGEAGKEEPVAGGVTGPLPFVDEGVPAWLSGVTPSAGPPGGPPALIDEPPDTRLEPEGEPFRVELPDWLTESQPAQAELEAAGVEEEVDAGLAHAELPSWVEELRPLESIIPGEAVVAAAAAGSEPGREEKLGPLAGMRGVLPGEEVAIRFRHLPAYSARLRVSERQRSHAALLQNVIDLEAIPREVPAVPSQAPQYIYRLVIAAVLIVALLAGMVFTDLRIFPAPQPTPADTGLLNLFNQIEALPPAAPVLLAVDYEPGLSGEMQMAASSVIEHLMQRDVRLVIVSTVPTGPLLANDLLRLVHPRKNIYDLTQRVGNLSYLPGGTTSLLEFAKNPSRAAPLAYDGSPAWDTPALTGIAEISDFSLVLVLTDSAETGRAWVEQVQPLLKDTPLSMVASAQAGPMLLPYHASGQITGLLSGFLGGAMYEQRSGRINLANVYWNSYQSGYLAGILLLILGGIISAVLTAGRKPRKKKA